MVSIHTSKINFVHSLYGWSGQKKKTDSIAWFGKYISFTAQILLLFVISSKIAIVSWPYQPISLDHRWGVQLWTNGKMKGMCSQRLSTGHQNPKVFWR